MTVRYLRVSDLTDRFEELENELLEHLNLQASNRRDELQDELQEEMKIEMAERGDTSEPEFDRWVQVMASGEDSLGAKAKEYLSLEDFDAELTPTIVSDMADDCDHPMHSEAVEYKETEDLLDDIRGSGGNHKWRGNWYPDVLIPDYDFEEFARDEAESMGSMTGNEDWPLNCIDWERAARELQMDYTSVEHDGTTYYYRA